jgi:hypothetical protein
MTQNRKLTKAARARAAEAGVSFMEARRQVETEHASLRPPPISSDLVVGASRPGRCWFCGKEHLVVGDPPEHIIQAALGGTLTTDRVARKCNSDLSKLIDKPFLDDFFVALERVFFDIRDPRRRKDRPPPNPRHEGELADGTPIKIEMRDGPWQPIIEPRLIPVNEKVFRITARSLEEAEAMMEKKLKRLQRDGFDVSSVSMENVKNEEAVEAKINISIDGTIRIRALAKMTLGVLSKVLPDEWLDTPDAKRLLSWLWEQPKSAGGKGGLPMAAPKTIPDLMSDMCAPPEHLIFFMPAGADAVSLLIVLFGREIMGHQIQLHGAPSPGKRAWAMDPKALTLQETDFDQLALRVVRAMIEAEGEDFPEAS